MVIKTERCLHVASGLWCPRTCQDDLTLQLSKHCHTKRCHNVICAFGFHNLVMQVGLEFTPSHRWGNWAPRGAGPSDVPTQSGTVNHQSGALDCVLSTVPLSVSSCLRLQAGTLCACVGPKEAPPLPRGLPWPPPIGWDLQKLPLEASRKERLILSDEIQLIQELRIVTKGQMLIPAKNFTVWLTPSLWAHGLFKVTWWDGCCQPPFTGEEMRHRSKVMLGDGGSREWSVHILAGALLVHLTATSPAFRQRGPSPRRKNREPETGHRVNWKPS